MTYLCQGCAIICIIMCIIFSQPTDLHHALDLLSVSKESFWALRLISGKDAGPVTWGRFGAIGIAEDSN